MADRTRKQAEPRQAAAPGKGQDRRPLAVVGIMVIIVIIAGALAYGLIGYHPTSFSAFLAKFDSAPRVAIYTGGNNGTAISSTVGCASAVIEAAVGSSTHHRDPNTIDFFVINQTACAYENGIGGQVKNYTYNSISNCLNTSKSEPSIFINYSTSGNSTVIGTATLRISGDQRFLSMCGVASEIS